MSRVGTSLLKVGMALSILGAIVLAIGLFTNSLGASVSGTASFGGVILIGPIPIVFGTDKITMLIGVTGAAIIMVAALIFFFVTTRRTPPQG